MLLCFYVCVDNAALILLYLSFGIMFGSAICVQGGFDKHAGVRLLLCVVVFSFLDVCIYHCLVFAFADGFLEGFWYFGFYLHYKDLVVTILSMVLWYWFVAYFSGFRLVCTLGTVFLDISGGLRFFGLGLQLRWYELECVFVGFDCGLYLDASEVDITWVACIKHSVIFGFREFSFSSLDDVSCILTGKSLVLWLWNRGAGGFKYESASEGTWCRPSSESCCLQDYMWLPIQGVGFVHLYCGWRFVVACILYNHCIVFASGFLGWNEFCGSYQRWVQCCHGVSEWLMNPAHIVGFELFDFKGVKVVVADVRLGGELGYLEFEVYVVSYSRVEDFHESGLHCNEVYAGWGEFFAGLVRCLVIIGFRVRGLIVWLFTFALAIMMVDGCMVTHYGLGLCCYKVLVCYECLIKLLFSLHIARLFGCAFRGCYVWVVTFLAVNLISTVLGSATLTWCLLPNNGTTLRFIGCLYVPTLLIEYCVLRAYLICLFAGEHALRLVVACLPSCM
eukprot:gene3200-2182_t